MGHTPDKPDSKSTADSVDAYFEDDTLEVTAGESVTSAGIVFDETTTTEREAAAAPEGTEFSLIDTPDGASIDAKTGAVTYAPSADTAAGETTISVKVSFSDGSDETVDLTVKVSAAAPTSTSSPAPTSTSTPAPTSTSTPAPTPDGSDGKGFLAGLFTGFGGISLLALASFGGILSLIVSLFHFFNVSIFHR
nr:Rib/alpha-like domain-containing protein [Corynebacterium sp. TAE3-ERU16]